MKSQKIASLTSSLTSLLLCCKSWVKLLRSTRFYHCFQFDIFGLGLFYYKVFKWFTNLLLFSATLRVKSCACKLLHKLKIGNIRLSTQIYSLSSNDNLIIGPIVPEWILRKPPEFTRQPLSQGPWPYSTGILGNERNQFDLKFFISSIISIIFAG